MSRAVRLGVFIVATLAILAAGIFIIGSKQYIFSSTYELKSQFADVEGLNEGGDVRIGGVHVGTVRSIVLPNKPDEKVTVVMDLEKSTHQIIKQDSVASIETEGLLGNQYLSISFGSSGSPNVRDGGFIASHPPLEMADLLQKASGILDSSQQAIQNTTRATANLDSITAKINRGQGTVGALVNDKQLYNNLAQTTAAMHQTIVKAEAGVDDFQSDMEALKHNFFLRGFFKRRGYEDTSELTEDEIERLPQKPPIKTFTVEAKKLFDKEDSAELKHGKDLKAGGDFLANNQFGLAVVVSSTGLEGDSQKDFVLSEARAAVVREYLVEHFGFDDRLLKTLGLGKEETANSSSDWGKVQILIYPEGTQMPPPKQTGASSETTLDPPDQASKPEVKKPQ